jgi:hypothetical protein
MSSEQHKATLQEILKEHEDRLQQALAVVHIEKPFVDNLRAAIQALSGPPTPLERTVARFADQVRQTQESGMPPRLAEFENMTVLAAIRTVLERAGLYCHADDIVRAIYGRSLSKAQFQSAKRTIVSEVIRGIEKKLFVRDGTRPNTFGRNGFLNGASLKTEETSR